MAKESAAHTLGSHWLRVFVSSIPIDIGALERYDSQSYIKVSFMPTLVCKSVIFYSQGDERAFFEFAKSIKGVRKIDGMHDEIHISVASRLSDASLRDILVLFQRYKIEMEQLSRFLTPRNSKWFRDEQKFWFRKTFVD